MLEYGRHWNEWHLLVADGSSGWLSDATADFTPLSRKLKTGTERCPGRPPAFTTASDTRGANVVRRQAPDGRAHYRGGEAISLSSTWDKPEVLFVTSVGGGAGSRPATTTRRRRCLFAVNSSN